MRSYVYGTCVLVGLLLNGAVYAEPLKINPYPHSQGISKMGEAPGDSASMAGVETSVSKMSLSGFRVPQPGDSYFEPPSQDDLRPVVQEQQAAVDGAEEQISADVQEDGFVQRAITAETFYGDKPVDFEAAEPMDAQAFLGEEKVSASAPIMEVQEEQPLVVRMSETIDDWTVEPDSDAQFEEVADPVHESEAPVAAVQEESVETVSEAPESIAWKGPRVPVYTPMVSEAVEPASGDALAEEIIEPTQQDAGPGWRAMEGQNIRQTLERWSQDEDAEIFWENQHAFAVLEPFEIRGSYEQAVQKLLDQYQSSEVRPVATLHVNPQNQRKTLVVRVVEGG